ncbi:hypothetical protein LAZ67_19001721, partial [Cordylochernes scorpioides]
MDTSIEPDHYEMQFLIFGATSSPCSAIYVKNENAMQHEQAKAISSKHLPQRYKEFVANRVGEIQEVTKGTDWRWVPTSDNPADITTRFETEISFEPTGNWYTRPEFLKRPEEEWPNEAKGKYLGTILATRMLKLGDDSRVSPSSDVECGQESGKLIRKISQRLLPERKFETFVDIERCVM